MGQCLLNEGKIKEVGRDLWVQHPLCREVPHELFTLGNSILQLLRIEKDKFFFTICPIFLAGLERKKGSEGSISCYPVCFGF